MATSSRHYPNNLPIALSSFIGRRREIVEVKRLLATTRLFTLIGAGGCGKTRLAIWVATELGAEFSDGVWLVELASLSNPELAPQTVATALGVREQGGRPLIDALTDYLLSREVLLVLDNCEHLWPRAQLAETLLQVCLLRAALEHSQMTENGADLGLRLAGALAHFWRLHGYLSEGRVRLSLALSQAGAQTTQDLALRARALGAAGLLAWSQSDYPATRSLCEESLALYRELGPAGRSGVAYALDRLGLTAGEEGDYVTAPERFEEA